MNSDEDFEDPIFTAFKHNHDKLKEKYLKEGRLQAYRKALMMTQKERDTLWELHAQFDRQKDEENKKLAKAFFEQAKEANSIATTIEFLMGMEEGSLYITSS
jgi:hypothetical protein